MSPGKLALGSAGTLGVILTLLGGSLSCGAVEAQSVWTDPSPHTRQLVKVEENVSIEVLDWGGSGRALVLLAQLSQTAHIYDEWATTLARDYHVIGITRRGFGGAPATSEKYSTERLATDILAVLEAEHLRSPILVGHGVAGEELSWIGANAPGRVSGLVYLDAAYDRTNVGAEARIAQRIPSRPPRPEDMQSVQSVTAWMSRGVGGRIPESEVRQLAEVAPDGRVLGQRIPPGIQQAVLQQLVTVDPSRIRVPVLAIYAKRTSPASQPGCQGDQEPPVREACQELYDWMTAQLVRSEALFKTIPSRAQVIEMPDASSFIFLSHDAEIRQALAAFVSELPK